MVAAAVALMLAVGILWCLSWWFGKGRTPAPKPRGVPGAADAARHRHPWPAAESIEEPVFGDDFLAKVREDLDQGIAPATIPLRMKIGRYVNRLRKESPEESLRLLSEVEMFYWPPPPRDSARVRFPLEQEAGAGEADRICMNRRFLKLFAELRAMPREQAAALVRRELAETLPLYQERFEATWKEVQRAAEAMKRSGTRQTAGPALQVSNNEDASPTPAGLRYKVLTLVLLAGNLQLDACMADIRKVAAVGLAQRDRFYGDDMSHKGDRFLTLLRMGLYNRQILAAGLQGAGDFDIRGAVESGTWESRKLPSYDAAATPYDMLTRGAGPIPVDYTKGSFTVGFPKMMNDEQFDMLAREAGARGE